MLDPFFTVVYWYLISDWHHFIHSKIWMDLKYQFLKSAKSDIENMCTFQWIIWSAQFCWWCSVYSKIFAIAEKWILYQSKTKYSSQKKEDTKKNLCCSITLIESNFFSSFFLVTDYPKGLKSRVISKKKVWEHNYSSKGRKRRLSVKVDQWVAAEKKTIQMVCLFTNINHHFYQDNITTYSNSKIFVTSLVWKNHYDTRWRNFREIMATIDTSIFVKKRTRRLQLSVKLQVKKRPHKTKKHHEKASLSFFLCYSAFLVPSLALSSISPKMGNSSMRLTI